MNLAESSIGGLGVAKTRTLQGALMLLMHQKKKLLTRLSDVHEKKFRQPASQTANPIDYEKSRGVLPSVCNSSRIPTTRHVSVCPIIITYRPTA